ncbi:MAG: RNase P subunit p30 family protein, partial [Nitrososphaerota archaeon]
LKELRKCRGSYEVVTVICRNLEVALVAVRDGRIDSIIIPPDKNYRIDKGVASTIKNAVEIPFKWILDEKSRRMFLKTVSEIILHLSRRTNIIVSSSASKPMELRGPYEMSSLLQIYSIDKKTALDAVSEIPSKIIEENLIKLSPNYIARGVVKIG